jgi:hypothetical protein
LKETLKLKIMSYKRSEKEQKEIDANTNELNIIGKIENLEEKKAAYFKLMRKIRKN